MRNKFSQQAITFDSNYNGVGFELNPVDFEKILNEDEEIEFGDRKPENDNEEMRNGFEENINDLEQLQMTVKKSLLN